MLLRIILRNTCSQIILLLLPTIILAILFRTLVFRKTNGRVTATCQILLVEVHFQNCTTVYYVNVKPHDTPPDPFTAFFIAEEDFDTCEEKPLRAINDSVDCVFRESMQGKTPDIDFVSSGYYALSAISVSFFISIGINCVLIPYIILKRYVVQRRTADSLGSIGTSMWSRERIPTTPPSSTRSSSSRPILSRLSDQGNVNPSYLRLPRRPPALANQKESKPGYSPTTYDPAQNSQGNDVTCAICLEPIEGNGRRPITALKCMHPFHLDCVAQWFLGQGRSCPVCRDGASIE